MNPRTILVFPSLLALFFLFSVFRTSARSGDSPSKAFEVAPDEAGRLPKGKEADGITGDWVMENGQIVAVVAGALPGRKANMAVHWNSETPGSIYDLCVAGSDNDQLTCFSPGDLRGPVSSVSAETTVDGSKAVVTVLRTAARGAGRAETHRYVMERNARHLLVVSTYSNLSNSDWDLKPEPVVLGLLSPGSLAGISYGDAMNPTDRQGYAWSSVQHAGAETGWAPTILQKGEVRSYAVAIAPGRSPAEAVGVVAALRGPVGGLIARVREKDHGIGIAKLLLWTDPGAQLPAYTDDMGEIRIVLPPAEYHYKAMAQGRPDVEGAVTITAHGETVLNVQLSGASAIHFVVEESSAPGANCPCKAQIIGMGTTANPYLGVDIQAHGCRNQYHSETGRFTVPVLPGDYRIVVTRGIEYSSAEGLLAVTSGGQSNFRARLERIVNTTGWVSSDFHNHSTPSGDNYCGTNDRLINLAAEGVEFAPTTEHNRIYDWAPHIQRLGLEEELATVVGIELTGSGAHLNAFPLRVVPETQDNGAPIWVKDPRVNALVLRNWQDGGAERYVQINHPRVGEFFRDRNADGVPDGGYAGLAALVDAAEVWSEEILNPAPWIAYKDRATGQEMYNQNRTFAWLQLLNQGVRMNCVAVSDAHAVFGNGVGGWRTYIPSTTDRPRKINPGEIIRNAKAGRMIVTNGPFLEVRTAEGTLPGGEVISPGGVDLQVKVQCTDWIEIDRVQVLVNGRQLPELDFTRAKTPEAFSNNVVRFQRTIRVPLAMDSHLIVVAIGEHHTLKKGYGESWEAAMKPVAFSNPIYIDTDGHGFQPCGDTLDQPLPTGKRP